MQRHWTRICALIMGFSLLVGILAACGSGTGTTTSSGSGSTSTGGSKTIRIGTDFPVSGKDAAGGKPAENGAHLAVDEANQQNLVPGYHFEFVPKDDVGPSGAHDPAVGQKNVTDLIGDALVAGIVGPLNSSVAQSEIGVTNQAPIAQLSPSNTNDCLTQTTPESECGGKNNKLPTYRPTNKVSYFRIATLDKFQGAALADFAYKTKGYHKVYVVDDTETYGVGIANSFVNEWNTLGGTMLGHKSVPPTTTSFVNLLTQIAATHPDLIFFGGNTSTGALPMRQQMQNVSGLKDTPFMGGDGMDTKDMAQTIRHNGGPVFTSTAGVYAQALDSAKGFIQKYNTTYGANNIGAYSAGSYDCAKIIIQAVKAAIGKGVATPKDSSDSAQAKVFRQAVIDEIQHIDYTGATGHHTFDENGDTTNKVITIYTIGKNPDEGDGWDYLDQVTVK